MCLIDCFELPWKDNEVELGFAIRRAMFVQEFYQSDRVTRTLHEQVVDARQDPFCVGGRNWFEPAPLALGEGFSGVQSCCMFTLLCLECFACFFLGVPFCASL